MPPLALSSRVYVTYATSPRRRALIVVSLATVCQYPIPKTMRWSTVMRPALTLVRSVSGVMISLRTARCAMLTSFSETGITLCPEL